MKLYDAVTGQLQGKFDIETSYPTSLAFTPDSRVLAVTQHTAVKLLNLPKLFGGIEPVRAEEMPELWDRLGSADAAASFRAECRLVLGGRTSAGFLQTRMQPVHETPPERLARFISDLRSEKFAVRENANRELRKLGQSAGLALRKSLEAGPPLEMRRRIDAMLTEQEESRHVRAVEVLASIRDESAHRVLQNLAAGLPGARITELARSALERKAKTSCLPLRH